MEALLCMKAREIDFKLFSKVGDFVRWRRVYLN
jgi:hypothetical protein